RALPPYPTGRSSDLGVVQRGPLRPAVLVALVVVSLTTVGAARRAAAALPSCRTAADVATDTGSAVTTAHQCGRRVEAVDRRTERSQTFANADGSLTLEASAMPQRVRRSDGSWATIDTTLRRGGDGRIASVATAVPVTLSGGGTGS